MRARASASVGKRNSRSICSRTAALSAGSSERPGSTTVTLATRPGSLDASSSARLPPVAAPTTCTRGSASASSNARRSAR